MPTPDLSPGKPAFLMEGAVGWGLGEQEVFTKDR